MDTNIPFDAIKELSVLIPPRTMICDRYIDNFVTIGLDINDNIIRIQDDSSLAIQNIFKHLELEEDISFKGGGVLFLSKEYSKETHAGKKVLGWLLYTQRFHIFLSVEKALDLIIQIDVTLNRGTTTEK